MLKTGKITSTEWNEKIDPEIKKGILKERKDLQEGGFLYIYQSFNTVVEDTDGILYNCSAWWPPSEGEGYVEITDHKPL